jgi:hypothetical protein
MSTMDFDLSHLDELRSTAAAALREAQARGASLFSADEKGGVFEQPTVTSLPSNCVAITSYVRSLPVDCPRRLAPRQRIQRTRGMSARRLFALFIQGMRAYLISSSAHRKRSLSGSTRPW